MQNFVLLMSSTNNSHDKTIGNCLCQRKDGMVNVSNLTSPFTHQPQCSQMLEKSHMFFFAKLKIQISNKNLKVFSVDFFAHFELMMIFFELFSTTVYPHLKTLFKIVIKVFM